MVPFPCWGGNHLFEGGASDHDHTFLLEHPSKVPKGHRDLVRISAFDAMRGIDGIEAVGRHLGEVRQLVRNVGPDARVDIDGHFLPIG